MGEIGGSMRCPNCSYDYPIKSTQWSVDVGDFFMSSTECTRKNEKIPLTHIEKKQICGCPRCGHLFLRPKEK